MKLRALFACALFYLLIAIIFTYPLITHLPNSLPGNGNDGYVYLWNIDTFWTQINLHQNPFQTNRVLYPLGTSLVFHTYAPFISLLGFAFQNNLVLFLNLIIILSFILTSLSANILAKHLTNSSASAFFAGLIYGFSPIMFSYLESGHYYYLFTAPLYPLSILFYLLFFQTKKIKFLLLLFLTFIICVGIDYYSTVLLITMIAIVIAITLLKKSLKFFLLFICVLIITITSAKLIYNLNKDNLFPQTIDYASFCHTNIAGFFIPNTHNVFLSKISTVLHQNLSVERTLDTPSYFLGWIIIFIALFSVLNFRKKPIIQITTAIFLVFFLLSLGTKIQLGGFVILSHEQTPFYWFSRLPFLYMIDCPLRFPIVIQLPLTIFFAFALKKIKPIFFIPVLALFFLEYNYSGLPLKKVEIPLVYHTLVTTEDNRTLLELPGGLTDSKKVFGYDYSIDSLNSKQMYWQTVHKKPKVGAYLSRIAPDKYNFFSHEPIVSDLFRLIDKNNPLPNHKYNSSEITSFIKKFNLGYIILSPNPRQQTFENTVDSWFNSFIKSKENLEGFILYVLL